MVGTSNQSVPEMAIEVMKINQTSKWKLNHLVGGLEHFLFSPYGFKPYVYVLGRSNHIPKFD
jgi:hypothetical protein